MFSDREDAGRQLAARLEKYANHTDVIVLGMPRGGVPVACEVAKALCAPLDIFVVRKLGVPGEEELAFGAIASGGGCYLDQDVIESAAMSNVQVQAVIAKERLELERREKAYRAGRTALQVAGKTVILADDGIATGASIRVAAQALRQLRPARLIIAVPVVHPRIAKELAAEADEIVYVRLPENFYAVGQFYEDFSEVTDSEVKGCLAGAQPAMQKAS
jgi:putative phosphoribosyl transferase